MMEARVLDRIDRKSRAPVAEERHPFECIEDGEVMIRQDGSDGGGTETVVHRHRGEPAPVERGKVKGLEERHDDYALHAARGEDRVEAFQGKDAGTHPAMGEGVSQLVGATLGAVEDFTMVR